jgi:thiol:disulfide interchange protein DsbD
MNHGRASLRWGILFSCLVATTSARAVAAEKHVKWSIDTADPFSDFNRANKPVDSKLQVRRGEVIRLDLNGKPDSGWHTYPIHKRAAGNSDGQMSTVTVKSKYFIAVGPVTESEPELVDEGISGKQFEFAGPFTFTVEIVVRPDAPVGRPLPLDIEIFQLVCKEQCFQELTTLTLPLVVSDAEPLPLSPDLTRLLKDVDDAERRSAEPKKNGKAETVTPSAPFDWEELEIEEPDEVIGVEKTTGLWATIIKAIVAGFISLVTPCVFPMIPVTVSIFLKRGEAKAVGASGPRPLTMALVYCGTIVAVLTAGGIALVSVLATISQHWATNLFLTFIFVFFALSLLGMYEIQLPSSLANLTGSKQGQAGVTGIVFMALTFSIISFACVGPIYGGFITLEAADSSADWLSRVAGPLAFSLAFTSPFFFLALFPSLLKSMPKSGSWMNAVKVVMGFLELAAAFKFIRAAEMNYFTKSEYFTFDLCLGAYVALSLACGLYLLGVFRLPHDHEAPESIGVGRLMASLTFITLGLYLLPGIFKDNHERSQKVRGVTYQWVRAFLLPDDPSDWGADLGVAIAKARKEGKPIFIDFTGVG